jgi:asparagine synthase (glutamine-hydrolysing)
MTALAGIWSFGGGEDLEPLARGMLEAQAHFGPDDPSIKRLGGSVFGRGLYRLVPEDQFDAQPLISTCGDLMCIADVRLDNRPETLDNLGLPQSARISDADLLFRAYQKWGETVLDRIVGDFAFAIWRASTRELTLARDPFGQRPLHYHVGAHFAAFASMPQGLHALPEVPRLLSRTQLARFVADLPRDPGSTYFEGVARVEPGRVLKISKGGVHSRLYWTPSTRDLRLRNDDSYIEAFREQLDRATASRLRGAGPAIAAHLSAGLDSSAVASTAAALMARDGGGVVAFTSAPRIGFAGPVPKGRIADESEAAASIAARYGNMEHVIVRAGQRSPLELLESASRMYQEPVGYPCNYLWWSAINDEAAARGISIRLTAEAGNLTFSAGGPGVLSEFVRRGQWLRWWREAGALRPHMPTWRGVLAASFGPWVPRKAWRPLTRLSSIESPVGGATLLQGDLRQEMEERRQAENRSYQPEKDEKAFRLRLLQGAETGNSRKGGLGHWRIDGRDPTADRRLVEFCLSLPPDQLLRGGVTRRMARVGLSDRVPEAVLNGPRGYQFADWYEMLSPRSFVPVLDALENTDAAELLDLDAVRRLASQWPGQNLASLATVGTFRMALLRAVSAGVFAATLGK